ncbi:hypothetical protein [Endozoicomonas sp. GU-1]|uniref:hypothetical protein n=1 Tax=Endozoicomonas sp. GU-1 TaxID=3009078 RepID=UPI0022B3F939|nr:hypothetical protein [Endozoicomonas sp. GU-1]WBA82937.1 hypothetical protein O2T12_07385 [Endozoicomonas sp. GU-1]WBA85864.1 hypothetical protein O3276_22025 [Endozoicomonas sp. GU-1]
MSDIFFYTSFAAYKTGAGGHKVIDILIIAIMSGAKTWEDIESYGHDTTPATPAFARNTQRSLMPSAGHTADVISSSQKKRNPKRPKKS